MSRMSAFVVPGIANEITLRVGSRYFCSRRCFRCWHEVRTHGDHSGEVASLLVID